MFKRFRSIFKYFKVNTFFKVSFVTNAIAVIKTLFDLLLLFHLLACVWVLLGQTDEGWLDKTEDDNLNIYVNAIYFVTATSTTVGYGDFFPLNSREKTFGIFLEFLGIIIFSVITSRILSLTKEKTIKDEIEEQEARIKNFLYQFDNICDINFNDHLYDSTIEFIKDNYEFGVISLLKGKEYYPILTPQQKRQLMRALLYKIQEQFKYFFNDFHSQIFADPDCIRKMIFCLEFQKFE
mmetsp:Transcript_14633/g.14266  ORF Transcript_14633/g.14266 Transcript_14633/m.14266 type:complete len:237 (+) Transcript_14633:793-1503(+)